LAVRLRESLWIEIEIVWKNTAVKAVRLRESLWIESLVFKDIAIPPALSGSVRACGLK